MDQQKPITVKISPGTNIASVACDILQRANEFKRPYQSEFNGVVLVANPGDSIDSVVQPWYNNQRRLAERDAAANALQTFKAGMCDELAAMLESCRQDLLDNNYRELPRQIEVLLDHVKAGPK